MTPSVPTFPTDTVADLSIPFDNTYARLPDRFFTRTVPTKVPEPRLIRLNESLSRVLGIDPPVLAAQAGVDVLAGNCLPTGAEPLAMAYAGHQFGGWAPQLGDGRAILLGEVIGEDGVRRDIQLKGAGPTPFSRNGDGRAVLGPVLREYLISEAMTALGLPSTRTLAAVTTGERIVRTELLPGAVLTRVACSHVRVGTFQFFAARDDTDGLRILCDYVIDRHYPEVVDSDEPYRALLEKIVARQAKLIAGWQLIGFIHGVMNTDNMSVVGETIDYGPCAFMDEFHPRTVYSSIDHGGRYAYGNQPLIAQWNLVRLAQALLPLLDAEEGKAITSAQAATDRFPALFQAAYMAGMRRKLGLASTHENDVALVTDLFDLMAEYKADFTLTFRRLCDVLMATDTRGLVVSDLFADFTALVPWIERWRQRLKEDDADVADQWVTMRSVNPAYIPRNHRVEEVIQAALNEDFTPFDRFLSVLEDPYADQSENEEYKAPPRPEEVVRETFCGT